MRAIVLASLLAAACGKVQALADAPGSGSDIDAHVGPDANPRGTVKVTVFDPTGTGATPTGIPVVFIDPDGTMVANVPTDSNGKAQADVLPGASVTAVFAPAANQYQMDAVLGVKPGDDLVIADTAPTAATGTFNVSYPSNGGAKSYQAFGPCGGGATSTTLTAQLTFSQFCTRSPMTVGVVAYDGNNQFLSYIEATNVTFADGGSTTINGSWPGQISVQASATNVPADVTFVGFFRDIGYPLGYGTSMGGGAPSGGTVTSSAAGPSASRALMQTTLRNGQLMQFIYQGVAGNSTSYSIDAGANALPWVGRPTLDVSNGTITNALSGATSTGDVYYVNQGYARSAGGVTTQFRWTIVTGTTDTITLPKMPAAVGDVNPQSTDTVSLFNGFAALLETDAYAGWDGARNHAFELADGWVAAAPPPAGATILRVSRTPFIAAAP